MARAVNDALSKPRAFALFLCSALAACGRGPDTPTSSSAAAREPLYAAETGCVECHASEVSAWKSSQHAVAIQEANDATVEADFDAPPFTSHGRTTTFARRGGRFFVGTEGRDGQRAEFAVRYTFGVAPLQQYLIELEHGRVACLTVAWDVERKRWFDLYPGEALAPGDEMHWTGRYQSWNAMCAQCHSTDLRKGYDAASDGYRTTWSEFTVACQACHGPATEHVALARAGNATPSASGFTSNLRHGEQRAQLDACAPCHAMRSPLTERWVHGEPLLDHFLPELLREGSYTVDGQMQGEVYVWGSFAQSRMARLGVACSDCHEPHTLALRGSGNQVCLQCHQLAPPVNRFATLKRKLYDSPEHTHHAAGSTGAQCVACHMPTTTFMQVDPRHDHAFRIPRPDESAALGVRNACNDCHADKDARWAAAAAAKWWPNLGEHPSFSSAFARGRNGERAAIDELERIAGDVERAPIVRASALELAGALGSARVASRALGEADPLVRLGALHGLENADPPGWRERVRPLLADPTRALRVEAARCFSVFDPARFDPALKRDFDRAQAEFVAAQAAQGDFPGSHLNLAVVHEQRGEFARAQTEYERALALDPAFLPARFNLAQLLQRTERAAQAEPVLREGLKRFPDEGELHHSLGLLLSQLGRRAEAADALARAAQLLPNAARVQYESGLAHEAARRAHEAGAALLRAAALEPASAEIQVALVQHFVSLGDWNAALPFAEALARLAPADRGALELIERVRSEAAARR